MLRTVGHSNRTNKPAEMPVDHHYALVFSSLVNGETVISYHDIINSRLADGRFVNADTVQTIAHSLTKEKKKSGWSHDAVLFENESSICWFRKPSKQPEKIWFRGAHSEPIELHVRLPGLIFIRQKWTRSLCVFAYAGKKRATPVTQLYYAPLCNVHASGSVCLGSAEVPLFDVDLDQFIEQTERGYLFDSNFTHVSHDKTFHCNSSIDTFAHIKKWRALASLDKWPLACDMSRYNKTLKEIIHAG